MSPRASRYGRYHGGDPLAPPVDLGEALDEIGQDVMAGYSPERAMQEFLRRGNQDRTGLDDLARRVAEKRRELTAKHNLDGTLQEVRELLDRAVLSERKQMARDVDLLEGAVEVVLRGQLAALLHDPAGEVVQSGAVLVAPAQELPHGALGAVAGHHVLADRVQRLGQVDWRGQRVGPAVVRGVPVSSRRPSRHHRTPC